MYMDSSNIINLSLIIDCMQFLNKDLKDEKIEELISHTKC